MGIVPAGSHWGKLYARKAAECHPVYSLATFRTVSETVALAESEGFVLYESAGSLFWKPGEIPGSEPHVKRRASEDAGFAALRFGNRGIARGVGTTVVECQYDK